MGLKDAANYMEKFGFPFLHGKTTAQFGSTEWNDFLGVLQGFSGDGAALTSIGCDIEVVAKGSPGELPHMQFVDRMDRAISRIWKGGDLSTMSRGHSSGGGGGSAVGSNPQMQNEDDLAKADAERLSETLQFYVDKYVIKYKFGVDKPLAKFTLIPPSDTDVSREIEKYSFAIGAGLPVSQKTLSEVFNIPLAEDGEELATTPAPPPMNDAAQNAEDEGKGKGLGLGNVSARYKRFQVTADKTFATAQAKALAPVRERLQAIIAVTDPQKRREELTRLKTDLPQIFRRAASSPDLLSRLETDISTALTIGLEEGSHKKVNGTNGHNHS